MEVSGHAVRFHLSIEAFATSATSKPDEEKIMQCIALAILLDLEEEIKEWAGSLGGRTRVELRPFPPFAPSASTRHSPGVEILARPQKQVRHLLEAYGRVTGFVGAPFVCEVGDP